MNLIELKGALVCVSTIAHPKDVVFAMIFFHRREESFFLK
jgi:hypothetical protein